MKWPLAKLYRGNAAAAATPHQSGQARQLLLKEKPFGERTHQLPPIAAFGFRSQLPLAGQQTAQLDARACEARPKGKNSRGRMALAPIRTREFSLPRGRSSQGHSQFYQLDFYVTIQPSLVLSWAPRKYRNSPPPHANEHIHRRSRWLSLCGHSPPSCANALTRKYDLPAA